MDIQDIITEYGTFYRDGGQNLTRVLKKPYIASQTEALFGLLPTDDTSYQMADTELSRILQPFQPGWTPLGGLKASPIILTQTPFKVDLEEQPDKLEASWLGFLADKNLNRAEWPIIRYIVEEHVFARMDEDFEMNEIYGGKFVAPTTGTPGAAGTGMDGIRIQLNRHISAGRITPIALGAIPTDPLAFCEYVETFVEGFSVRYRGRAMEVCMNTTLARRYAKGATRSTSSTPPTRRPSPSSTATATRCCKSRLSSPSTRWWAWSRWGPPRKSGPRTRTTASAWPRRRSTPSRCASKAPSARSAILTDFWKGIGFPSPQAVFTNELDLTI